MSSMAEKLTLLRAPAASQHRWWRRTTLQGNWSGNVHWHLFEGVEQSPATPWKVTLVAKCGYKFMFDGVMGDSPYTKIQVRTKKLRCSKCEAKEAKENDVST